MDNSKFIWDFLKSKKLTDYAVAGIMGNLYAESGLISTNLQNNFEISLGMNDVEYTKAVDNRSYKNFSYDSAGYGLAQWTFWSRKEKLLLFAKDSNRSIGDLQMQLEFFIKELQGYVSLDELNNSESVTKASNLILLQYERPADQSSKVKSLRASYGKKYYDKFHNDKIIEDETKPETKPFMVKITAEVLNYRKAPGINSVICGTINNGGVYTITEVASAPGAKEWGKLKSGVGWISLDYVEKIS